MTPVPAERRLEQHLPAPKWPSTSCGMVPLSSGILNRFFFACSVPLRIASGTSFALPRPAPTWPFWSPTTTSAENEKRRPPLTTLATRLMWTTRSTSSPTSFMLMAIRSAPLELEAGFARGVGERHDAPVIDEPVAVEDDLVDALRLAASRAIAAPIFLACSLFFRPVELRP